MIGCQAAQHWHTWFLRQVPRLTWEARWLVKLTSDFSALTHVIDINAEFSFRAIVILIAACDAHHNNNQKPILYFTSNIFLCFFLPNLHCPSSRSQYWGNYFEEQYLIFKSCKKKSKDSDQYIIWYFVSEIKVSPAACPGSPPAQDNLHSLQLGCGCLT